MFFFLLNTSKPPLQSQTVNGIVVRLQRACLAGSIRALIRQRVSTLQWSRPRDIVKYPLNTDQPT